MKDKDFYCYRKTYEQASANWTVAATCILSLIFCSTATQ